MKKMPIIIIIVLTIAFYFFSSTKEEKLCKKVFKAIKERTFTFTPAYPNYILTGYKDVATLIKVREYSGNKKDRRKYNYLDYEYVYFDLPIRIDKFEIVSSTKSVDTIRIFNLDSSTLQNFETINIKCKVFIDKEIFDIYTLYFVKEDEDYLLAAILNDNIHNKSYHTTL